MTRNEAIEGLITLLEVRRKYCDMQTMRDEIEAIEMAIEALGQESRWIPVSERLPEEGRYLTTILNGKLRYKMVCDYYRNGCWCPDDQCAGDNVIAWMPLPESYKAESEEV